MKALTIPLGKITKEVDRQYNTDNIESYGGSWCGDIVTVELTVEEVENLTKLGRKYPHLKLTEAELDRD